MNRSNGKPGIFNLMWQGFFIAEIFCHHEHSLVVFAVHPSLDEWLLFAKVVALWSENSARVLVDHSEKGGEMWAIWQNSFLSQIWQFGAIILGAILKNPTTRSNNRHGTIRTQRPSSWPKSPGTAKKLPRWHAFVHSTVHEVPATLRNLQGGHPKTGRCPTITTFMAVLRDV